MKRDRSTRHQRGWFEGLGCRIMVLVWLGFASALAAAASETNAPGEAPDETPEPELDISGYGLLGNIRLKNQLKILVGDQQKDPFLSANYLEDAVMIILSRLNQDGYLRPVIQGELRTRDGKHLTHAWEGGIEEPLPRPLEVVEAQLRIEEGVLYHYEEIEFEESGPFTQEEGTAFFVDTGPLLRLDRHRIYTPRRLERSLANMEEVLARRGYPLASAEAVEVDRTDSTGAVNVRILVKPGNRWMVRTVRTEVERDGGQAPEVSVEHPEVPYSKLWEQDQIQEVKKEFYKQGYADVEVKVTVERRQTEGEIVWLEAHVAVKPGPKVYLNEVRFVGYEKTRPWALHNTVPLKEGAPLDRTQVEEGRHQLIRLGVFDGVDHRYETVDPTRRNVVYQVQEGKEIDMSVMLGYGSYELLRGGLELRQYNLFGLAHHADLKLVQSFKASSVEYLYVMPNLSDYDIDFFLDASGLRREEVSFTREELSIGVGGRRWVEGILSDVGLSYNYQILNAANTEFVEETGPERSLVSSLVGELRHDQRDNPLAPRRGYKVYSNLELASEYFGGEVNYQRFDFSTSYHHPVGKGRWVHLGLSHGFAVTLSGSDQDLPFNKRFFLGGENSVRGYQQGEASPLDENGESIGAETFVILNVEFEQALTPTWSLVLFVDSIGFARDLGQYPFDETLFSAGGGLRWNTLIGPARLEYGHNLNPRSDDPGGTLHFSIGFPF